MWLVLWIVVLSCIFPEKKFTTKFFSFLTKTSFFYPQNDGTVKLFNSSPSEEWPLVNNGQNLNALAYFNTFATLKGGHPWISNNGQRKWPNNYQWQFFEVWINKKMIVKAVYFVRFAMFEVAITKKPVEKAAKTFHFRTHIKRFKCHCLLI